jgi:hypothetical protein
MRMPGDDGRDSADASEGLDPALDTDQHERVEQRARGLSHNVGKPADDDEGEGAIPEEIADLAPPDIEQSRRGADGQPQQEGDDGDRRVLASALDFAHEVAHDAGPAVSFVVGSPRASASSIIATSLDSEIGPK